MKLSKPAVVFFCVSLVGAGLVVACGGDDDDSGTTPAKDAGVTDSGSATVADTGSTVVDSGSTVDAGTDAGDAGLKALGQTCAANAECESAVCFMGGTGGGPNSAGNYCTIACDNAGASDPKCANKTGLTGKCNGKSYCQPTTH